MYEISQQIVSISWVWQLLIAIVLMMILGFIHQLIDEKVLVNSNHIRTGYVICVAGYVVMIAYLVMILGYSSRYVTPFVSQIFHLETGPELSIGMVDNQEFKIEFTKKFQKEIPDCENRNLETQKNEKCMREVVEYKTVYIKTKELVGSVPWREKLMNQKEPLALIIKDGQSGTLKSRETRLEL